MDSYDPQEVPLLFLPYKPNKYKRVKSVNKKTLLETLEDYLNKVA